MSYPAPFRSMLVLVFAVLWVLAPRNALASCDPISNTSLFLDPATIPPGQIGHVSPGDSLNVLYTQDSLNTGGSISFSTGPSQIVAIKIAPPQMIDTTDTYRPNIDYNACLDPFTGANNVTFQKAGPYIVRVVRASGPDEWHIIGVGTQVLGACFMAGGPPAQFVFPIPPKGYVGADVCLGAAYFPVQACYASLALLVADVTADAAGGPVDMVFLDHGGDGEFTVNAIDKVSQSPADAPNFAQFCTLKGEVKSLRLLSCSAAHGVEGEDFIEREGLHMGARRWNQVVVVRGRPTDPAVVQAPGAHEHALGGRRRPPRRFENRRRGRRHDLLVFLSERMLRRGERNLGAQEHTPVGSPGQLPRGRNRSLHERGSHLEQRSFHVDSESGECPARGRSLRSREEHGPRSPILRRGPGDEADGSRSVVLGRELCFSPPRRHRLVPCHVRRVRRPAAPRGLRVLRGVPRAARADLVGLEEHVQPRGRSRRDPPGLDLGRVRSGRGGGIRGGPVPVHPAVRSIARDRPGQLPGGPDRRRLRQLLLEGNVGNPGAEFLHPSRIPGAVDLHRRDDRGIELRARRGRSVLARNPRHRARRSRRHQRQREQPDRGFSHYCHPERPGPRWDRDQLGQGL